MLGKIISYAVIGAGLTTQPALASLLLNDVVITNTFQGSVTGGVEIFIDSSTANVSSGALEFPGFIDLYDVDITADSIAFTWIDTPFSNSVSGSTPLGNFDRNLFVFDLPANMNITGITFDAFASQLLSGSAMPSAQLIAPNQVLTVFDEGVIRNIGFNPVFTVTTSSTTVPEPMTLALVCIGLAGAFRMRHRIPPLS